MAVFDLRSTQKIRRMNTEDNNADKIKDMEVRMKSIEQSLNLILQKLDNGNSNNGNNISSISK